ncbi:FHA domain-containing protein [Georgenia daeguensis]|uniref:FHA domain-containing protein n=1 Tax=Georgenia daeguensis TaxID=908355 RepID=A0ABP8EQJ5_9MICO
MADRLRARHDRWDVVLTVPADAGSLGLHEDEAHALDSFRTAVAAAVGTELPARARDALDEAFRAARSSAGEQGVLWSGFVAAAVPAAVPAPEGEPGPDGEPAPGGDAPAATSRPVVVLLEIRLAPLGQFPSGSPVTPAAVLARGLRQLYGDDARTHLVTYDGEPAVAVVRTQQVATTGMTLGGRGVPAGSTPVEMLRAEVHRPFPADGALVAVVATTWLPECLDDAVVLAGTLARGVRLRDLTRPTMGVRVADGRALDRGRTLVGRQPEADGTSGPVHAVLALDDRTVSRSHCVVDLRADSVLVRDLDSSNGTVVERPDGTTAPCPPGEVVEVLAGSRLRLGAQVLEVERAGPSSDPETSGGGK